MRVDLHQAGGREAAGAGGRGSVAGGSSGRHGRSRSRYTHLTIKRPPRRRTYRETRWPGAGLGPWPGSSCLKRAREMRGKGGIGRGVGMPLRGAAWAPLGLSTAPRPPQPWRTGARGPMQQGHAGAANESGVGSRRAKRQGGSPVLQQPGLRGGMRIKSESVGGGAGGGARRSEAQHGAAATALPPPSSLLVP